MPAKSVGAGEPPAATPVVAVLQVATANELFLSRVQTFMTFTVVLARKSLATNAANKRPFVGVGT
jgi:hypothetical protein